MLFVEIVGGVMNTTRHEMCIKKLIYFLLLLIFAYGCKDKEGYKKEIELKGIQYSRESFLTEVEKGNDVLTDLFIKAGIDVNAKDTHEVTALMIAAMQGKLNLVRVLIENGAGVNARDTKQRTPLMYSVTTGNSHIVKLLLDKGADINAKADGISALSVAAGMDKLEVVKLLIDNGADVNINLGENSTPQLVFLIESGKFDMAKLLIENGADVNSRSKDGLYPLKSAISAKHFELIRVCL